MTDVSNDLAALSAAFCALHEADEPFLIPNPWDAGSARLLAHMGFSALATTSLGVANNLGRRGAGKDAILENCRQICAATSLPVNADLENCFADDPETAGQAMAMAFDCGAVGASIEDATQDRANPVYDFDLAVERVQAAVEVARKLPVRFLVTARAENLLHGRDDLDDTIRRLQAFEAVGADVLYAPGVKTLEQIRTVTSAVGKPFNVVMGFADPSITLDQLGEAGVRRVSIGGAFSRVALQAFMNAAAEMREGRFGFVRDSAPIKDLWAAFPK